MKQFLTNNSDMETATLLYSTVTSACPRDTMPAYRKGIILIVVAGWHNNVNHVGSWKLPFIA